MQGAQSERFSKTLRSRTNVRRARATTSPRRSDWTLHIVVGPYRGRAFPLEQGIYAIGRSRNAQVRVPWATVSRVHAELSVGPDGCASVANLSSKNATMVNGVAVCRQRLRDGDHIALGDVVLKMSARTWSPDEDESRATLR